MLRVVNTLLLAFYALLWMGGAVSHVLWQETPPEAGWAASAYLATAAALLLLNTRGNRGWLAAVGAAGFAAELAGSTFGLFFGSYSYTDILQPQLVGVPLVMACAWVILLSYVKSLLPILQLRPFAEVFAGSVWMAAIDLAIDPVATRAVGYWRWDDSGWYYGVPVSNFAGWVLISAVLLGSGTNVTIEGGLPRWIGFSVVAFFGVLAAAHGMFTAAIVASVLCLCQIWLERNGRHSASRFECLSRRGRKQS